MRCVPKRNGWVGFVGHVHRGRAPRHAGSALPGLRGMRPSVVTGGSHDELMPDNTTTSPLRPAVRRQVQAGLWMFFAGAGALLCALLGQVGAPRSTAATLADRFPGLADLVRAGVGGRLHHGADDGLLGRVVARPRPADSRAKHPVARSAENLQTRGGRVTRLARTYMPTRSSRCPIPKPTPSSPATPTCPTSNRICLSRALTGAGPQARTREQAAQARRGVRKAGVLTDRDTEAPQDESPQGSSCAPSSPRAQVGMTKRRRGAATFSAAYNGRPPTRPTCRGPEDSMQPTHRDRHAARDHRHRRRLQRPLRRATRQRLDLLGPRSGSNAAEAAEPDAPVGLLGGVLSLLMWGCASLLAVWYL